jgi:hypothetical protein
LLSFQHGLPPKATSTSIVRVLVWTPPPQVSEHAPKLLKPETTQSTGQLPSLQVFVSFL